MAGSKTKMATAEHELKHYTEMDRRIALCRGTKRSNCIGTALYVAGEQEEDVLVRVSILEELKKLEEISLPVEKSIVVWTNSEVAGHMGIVASVEPLLITGRDGKNGVFIENKPLSEVTAKYSSYFIKKFYLPQRLELAMTGSEVNDTNQRGGRKSIVPLKLDGNDPYWVLLGLNG